MRITVDVTERAGELVASVTAPGQPAAERPVRWTSHQRLLVAKDDPVSDAEADTLATALDAGTATKADLKRYGALLFEAVFGSGTWQALTDHALADAAKTAEAPYLELAIRGLTPGVQALRWEALHDGTVPVAAMGTGGQPALPVGIVRLVSSAPPHAPNGSGFLSPSPRIPRVLFAVGSRLTDPRIRPAAEFMGIMRHLERWGGAIQPHILEQSTLQALTERVRRVRPDVLHIMGHGRHDAIDGTIRLQLRPESPDDGGDEWVTADRLLGVFTEAGHTPAMIVLSACQAGAPGQLNALPFAAGLVAGGVPVVVAMAGDIADTACRVFTRALTHAISDGVPVTEAVVRGRCAAFYQRPGPDSADWLLPVLFLAEDAPPDVPLVDPAPIEAARRRCHDLEVSWEPVFCGRTEFVEAMDRLLDATDPLNVLVAHTADSRQSYGGLRLLRELAARAVRAGRIPVLLGPFDENPPVSLEDLAGELWAKLEDMRALWGLPDRPDSPDRLADAAGKGRRDLARTIRSVLAEFTSDLPSDDPVHASDEPRAVLLCHRVDLWNDLAYELFAEQGGMLGPRGLGRGTGPLPTVLTGADEDDLKKARVRCNGSSWAKFLPLDRFRQLDEDPEDILAYQWWLLNPPDRTPVYAPRRDVDPRGWHDTLRLIMRDKAIYDPALFEWAKTAQLAFLTSDKDYDLLAGYDRGTP